MDDDGEEKDLSQGRKFNSMFWFIYDLSVFNDGGEFEKVYQEIFLPELTCENRSDPEVSFLDLDRKTFNQPFMMRETPFHFPL